MINTWIMSDKTKRYSFGNTIPKGGLKIYYRNEIRKLQIKKIYAF